MLLRTLTDYGPYLALAAVFFAGMHMLGDVSAGQMMDGATRTVGQVVSGGSAELRTTGAKWIKVN